MNKMAYGLRKLLREGGKWLALEWLALALLLSATLNVKLFSDVGDARRAAEEQRKRAVVATQGLSSTAHLLYLTNRTAIAESCLVDALTQQPRRRQSSEEFKRAMAEAHKSEENAGVECKQLEPERSEAETARLVEDKIQEEMRKMK